MENLKLDVIKNLKPGERIEIPSSTEQVAELELIYLKLNSYQNLFASFMAKTVDKADEFNLQKFMDVFAEHAVREYFMLKSLLEPEVGEAVFNIIKCPNSHLTIDIDGHNKKLYIINKLSVENSCSCSEQE